MFLARRCSIVSGKGRAPCRDDACEVAVRVGGRSGEEFRWLGSARCTASLSFVLWAFDCSVENTGGGGEFLL
jgi:hypothetical protein